MQFASLPDLNFHYALDGPPEGHTLVFINSLGTDLRSWDALVVFLAQDYRCIRYDKRGHGLSDCPPGPYSVADFSADHMALLAHLGITEHTLVGISIGGLIAMDVAIQAGPSIRGLVLSDTAAKIGVSDTWQARMDAVEEKGLEGIVSQILPRWFAPGFADSNPALYRAYAHMLARQPAEGYIASCAALRDGDLGADVAEIKTPTLVLCGAQDSALAPEASEDLAASLPNAHFVEIEGAGHLPPIEQPEEFAEQLRVFVETFS